MISFPTGMAVSLQRAYQAENVHIEDWAKQS